MGIEVVGERCSSDATLPPALCTKGALCASLRRAAESSLRNLTLEVLLSTFRVVSVESPDEMVVDSESDISS